MVVPMTGHVYHGRFRYIPARGSMSSAVVFLGIKRDLLKALRRLWYWETLRPMSTRACWAMSRLHSPWRISRRSEMSRFFRLQNWRVENNWSTHEPLSVPIESRTTAKAEGSQSSMPAVVRAALMSLQCRQNACFLAAYDG